ncbi:hypothetical protein D4764_05G0011010 [Takifugu flavidus]|uniref:Uncharacterized protein n=1 Tax=Takifugu flavidus TaxID=433684 RepID=A0A5C6N3S8_9TELE|nr:hypothetical protein D4764_05G0011010 [Takifugu flavidus]
MKSSNNEDPSDEATTTAAAAGARSPPTDSKARPGTNHVPTRIKKFLHFPRSYSDLKLLRIALSSSSRILSGPYHTAGACVVLALVPPPLSLTLHQVYLGLNMGSLTQKRNGSPPRLRQ